MVESSHQGPFYVSILASADESDLIADIVYAGRQVAGIQRVDGTWAITFCRCPDAAELALPLTDFRAALTEASERLQAT